MRLAAAALACVLIGAGCSSNRGAEEPGTVNFLIESMPANLDPRIGTDAQSQHLDGLIFDSLLAHDAQMNIVADLAERWEARDPVTYVFHLRQGVKFHDGRPLTSADVKFTFDSILDGTVKTPKRGAFRMVTAIEAPDDSTVVFHLREPYASFLWNLTKPGVGIVPRGSGPEIAQHPIGTGPFRFVDAITDQEIVLERNPSYFGDAGEAAGVRGNVERVRFRIVPDAIVRALELRKGSADVAINSLSPDMVVTLAKERGIVADEQPGTTIAYIGFNLEDPILSHREVRQALAYATDRATLIKYLMRGQARAASSLLPPNHWAYDPDVQAIRFRSSASGTVARCGRIQARGGRGAVSAGIQDIDGGIFAAFERGDCGRMATRGSGGGAAAAGVCDVLCRLAAREFSGFGAALGRWK